MNGHAQPSSIRTSSRSHVRTSAVATAALVVLFCLLAYGHSASCTPHLQTPQVGAGVQAAPAGQTPYQVLLQVGAGSFAYNLPLGASVTLPISASVTGAQPLAAVSVLIQYNPAVLRPTACVTRPGSSTGGYCNAAYDPENGLVRFNLISDTGVMGDAALFDLTFETASTAAVRQQSAVTLLVESATDIHGDYMTSQTQGSTVTIVASGAGAAVYVGAPGGPNPISITRGLTATVPVVITGVAGVGSATFALSFDPAIVRPLECRPLPTPYGDASGMCVMHSDHVAANLLSPTGIPASAAQNVTAFEVVFTTAPPLGALKDQTSPLTLAAGAFANTAGASIPVRLIDNALKVTKTAAGVVPLLRLAPLAQDLLDDGRVTVNVYLDGGSQLAAGSWGIRYDPTVVLAEECWPSTLVNAACNAIGEPGAVRMSVLAIEAAPPPQIAAITFRRHPQAKAGQESSLTFEVTNFANAAGEQLAYDTLGAELTISEVLGSSAAAVLRLIGTPPYLLYRGTSLDLPINLTVDPTRPIANLTASIHYDPLVLRPTRCLATPAIGGTGPMGYCNAQYDREQGIIRFNLLAAGGVSGSLTPFILTLEPTSTAVQGNNSPLHFTVEAVTGPLGEARTWSATDETILIKAPVPAPRVLIGPPELLATAIYTIALGSRATVPLWVGAVPDLGAGTVEIRYDATVARATRCTLRPDLTPSLDGGFCSLLDPQGAYGSGVVRAAFVSSAGIDGDAHLFDIEFAQAPDAVAGETTPLAVVVNNFVNTHEAPIPTSTRSGQLDISCYAAPVTDLKIARDGNNLLLTWSHVGSTASRYQVWRADVNAYFAFGDLGSTAISTTVPAPILGARVAYTDTIGVTNPISGTITGPWADDLNHYYMVRSMCAANQGSLRSNRVGKFTRMLSPGWNLVSWPLLVYQDAQGLDAVLGVQLHGTDNPETADRVLVWGGTAYTTAWFCGSTCTAPRTNHWLATSYAPSPLKLPPDIGFWIQNRSGASEVAKIVGDVAEADRTLAISSGWSFIGSAFSPLPAGDPLDAAGLLPVGTNNPETADRVLVWDETLQKYTTAWFCGGPDCVGLAYANRWLANSWAPTDIVVCQPGYGFWFQNRHGPTTWPNKR